MTRRVFAAVLAGVLLLAGCATVPQRPGAGLWHGGRLFIATGNTTGVYYTIGGGYADLITKHVAGYEARAEATGASGENIERVASGDMDVALTLADTAADAYTGKGAFDGGPRKIVALARVYKSYIHLVVRNSSKITKFSDLRGKRVSTGSAGSGIDIVAGRLLFAGAINPDTEMVRQRLSLPETTKSMQAGTTDAFFFAGGLPTPGISDLLNNEPGQYSILPLSELIQPLTYTYGSVYGLAKLPASAYSTPTDIDTVVIGNLIVVSPEMPEELAYQLTKVLFEHQIELSRVHPEGGNFDRASAPNTDPVPLHPGAARYYSGG
ncbi:TAXI family TRAP transporter solute-binding subunit [Dactylosporangium sp. AC04546]|uniref:TAXI family TRAP transporter solute-binding subunit n=1 Tax=Dactylosporangium sp. AC04546 TaxID=2862460 RepID=UPI001EE0FAE1|nr:TAXI family TRAP transporter solute-binding subunit [Dactylosporangium sp. AC04546]WVK83605.1 TAXI family TRAP transporter solute-binding subunit [Dactylosporangium sp. AC04546]